MVPGQPNTFINAVGYADGGEVMPGLMPQGAPPPAMGGNPGNMDASMLDARITDALRKDPAIEQQVTQVLQEAMASGELTLPELNQLFQLAKAAAQSPNLWPQLRTFVINQGIADPEELPEQYDQGLVTTVLILAKVAEKLANTSAGAPQGMGVRPPQGMGQGLQQQGPGLLQGPGTGTSDSIPAVNMANGGQVGVSTGEYVIPADVVKAKGVDFFDGMVRKYHSPAGFKG